MVGTSATMAMLLVGAALALHATSDQALTPRNLPQRSEHEVRAAHEDPAPPGPVGWEAVNNGNMPRARGTMGFCTHPTFGLLVFGGEVSETEFVDETWLLPATPGTWQLQDYAPGHKPSNRSNPAMARYNEGCLLFGGIGVSPGYVVYSDTWFWTPFQGWRQLLTSPEQRALPHPSPRFYHTLNELSDGNLFLFGGRHGLYGTTDASLGDSWTWSQGRWHRAPIPDRLPAGSITPEMTPDAQLRHQPRARWGHGMACGLTNTGPATGNDFTGFGVPECVMFGGSQFGDDDYFQDTWILKREFARGNFTNRYFWEQMNSNLPSPHGRWCFSMATCGSRVLMIGGSTDFRVSADETWMWSPTIRPVELPEHPPAHQGEWNRLYGSDSILEGDWPDGVRPDAAGPYRITGFGIGSWGALGQSDVILYGGVKNATGGLYMHKGWETSEMFRWSCPPEPAPPPASSPPPPPPSLPPLGEPGSDCTLTTPPTCGPYAPSPR